MKYIKKGSKVKVKWNSKNIFPIYKDISGSHVSQKRINRAKNIVIEILNSEKNKIDKAFKKLINKKYKDKNIIIKYYYNSSIQRVKNAKLSKESDIIDAETDDNIIWICKNKLSDAHLIGAILHESIHYLARFNNKEICEKDEHYVMELLGEKLN